MIDDLFFAITKDIFKIYFKSLVFSKLNAVVLRFEIASDKSFSLTPVFTTLILLPLFQIIKTPQCCCFTLTNFLFFLMANNALVTSWVTFSSTIFPIFWFVFPMVAWWKQTLHLCISEVECYVPMMKNRKVKTHSNTLASQNTLFIDAIVHC